MAVGTCHRPLSWITGHSYCPFKSIVWLSCIVSYRHYLRSKAIVDCYLGCRNLSPPIIMDSRSFVLSLAPAVDAVQHCCYLVFSARNSIAYELITPGYTCCARLSDLVFVVVWAEDIVSAAPCCQNWHPPVLGSQPIVLSCIRTFSETQLWCSAWSLRRRCSWVRIARSHWIGNSVYCLRHRLMSQLSRWLPFSREPQDYDLARKAMAWGWYPTYSRERHYLSCAATQPSLSELWSVVDSDISVVKG